MLLERDNSLIIYIFQEIGQVFWRSVSKVLSVGMFKKCEPVLMLKWQI